MTSDEVLAFHERLTLWGVVPVPVRVSVVVVCCALLVNVSKALTEPVTSGLNVTENDAL